MANCRWEPSWEQRWHRIAGVSQFASSVTHLWRWPISGSSSSASKQFLYMTTHALGSKHSPKHNGKHQKTNQTHNKCLIRGHSLAQLNDDKSISLVVSKKHLSLKKVNQIILILNFVIRVSNRLYLWWKRS